MGKSLRNNMGLKLLAFLSAFLLWLIVVNLDDPIDTKSFDNIPVVVEHEEVITTEDRRTYQVLDNTQAVSVVVSARRSVLSRIRAEDIVASADMRELYMDSLIPIEVGINGFPIESAVADPRNMRVKIENNTSNTFPITPVTRGLVRDGYVLGSLKADPERITINGPESVVERITRVVAEADVSGLSEDVTLDSVVTLYDADNNVIDQSLLGNNLGDTGVSIQVTLLHTKSIPIQIDESLITAQEGYRVSEVVYSPQEILIAGEESLLKGITQIVIPADALAISEISRRTEKTVDITPYLPEGTELVDETGNNVLVTVSVERDGTKSFNLPIGSISVKNLDENLAISYSSQDDLEIYVRGPKEALDGIDIGKAASIDLEGCKEAGTYKIPVEIDLPEGCALEESVEVEVVLEEKE